MKPVNWERLPPVRKTYRVRLGFMQTVVEADNEAEAIRLARKALATELPRHWDMIYQALPERFEVVVLESTSRAG